MLTGARAISKRYRLFVARSRGEAIAVHLASYVGDTSVFLVGAGNEEARRTNASYLLHWRAVEETIRLGLRWYDLGGVDRVANPSGYRFKNGMRGIEVDGTRRIRLRADPIRGASLLSWSDWAAPHEASWPDGGRPADNRSLVTPRAFGG